MTPLDIYDVQQRTAIGHWQTVEVTFAAAYTDTVVPHRLASTTVRFLVVDRTAPGTVFRGTKPATADYLVLQASLPGTYRLEVFLEADHKTHATVGSPSAPRTTGFTGPRFIPRTILTSSATGTLNDFAPGIVGDTILYLMNTTTATISGFAGGVDGQRLVLKSAGTGQVDLLHQQASAAGNQLSNVTTSAITSLAAGTGWAEYLYDGSAGLWRLVSHEQGAWIAPSPPTVSGSGSMTVTSPSFSVWKYLIRGRTLHLMAVGSWTLGGTASTEVRLTLPAGAQHGTTTARGTCVVFNPTARLGGYQTAASGGSATFSLFVDLTFGSTNWTLGLGGVNSTFLFDIT